MPTAPMAELKRRQRRQKKTRDLKKRIKRSKMEIEKKRLTEKLYRSNPYLRPDLES